jgi:hypothetical protein
MMYDIRPGAALGRIYEKVGTAVAGQGSLESFRAAPRPVSDATAYKVLYM